MKEISDPLITYDFWHENLIVNSWAGQMLGRYTLNVIDVGRILR